MAKHPTIAPLPTNPPELPGVEHRWITTPSEIKIHVALAGPETGRPVMLVHGFPQHWWEWRHQIAPLAADGYRVIVPDLRGAGWSDTVRGPYRKSDMGDDLAAVVDALGVGPVKLVAHDWGGPVAFCMLLDHPDKASGFLGLNTLAPILKVDLGLLKHAWAFWYQFPMLTPAIGPRVLAQSDGRYLRMLCQWVAGSYRWSEEETQLFLGQMQEPARAYAGSQWYRTFQAREFLCWTKRYQGHRVNVPVRWVTGLDDPVVTPTLHRWYADVMPDCEFQKVPGIGHWIVEQAPELVLDRIRELMKL